MSTRAWRSGSCSTCTWTPSGSATRSSASSQVPPASRWSTSSRRPAPTTLTRVALDGVLVRRAERGSTRTAGRARSSRSGRLPDSADLLLALAAAPDTRAGAALRRWRVLTRPAWPRRCSPRAAPAAPPRPRSRSRSSDLRRGRERAAREQEYETAAQAARRGARAGRAAQRRRPDRRDDRRHAAGARPAGRRSPAPRPRRPGRARGPTGPSPRRAARRSACGPRGRR